MVPKEEEECLIIIINKQLTFKMNNGVDLINISVHPRLADHLAGDALGLVGRRLEQRAELVERDVVVQLAG